MKKSLVKYIISSQKDNVCFEDRLSEIFSRSLGSETSLETLVYGIPKSVKILDKQKLLKAVDGRYTSSKVCIREILNVSVTSDFRISVQYKYDMSRYFSTEEARDNAVKNGRKYDGVSEKDSSHPIEGVISELTDDVRFEIDDLENIVEVVRE